jgi:hypothetical protein
MSANSGPETRRLIWLMLGPGGIRQFRYVKAEAPCWKGEVNVPLFGWSVTIGWQR